jgi:hypothetical protein
VAESASAWVERQLQRLGRRRAGPDRRVRATPWSQVVRVPTTNGDLWFKACRPAVAHEPAVYRIVPGRAPGLMLEPVAANERRGWLLLPDASPTLREQGPELARWEAALADYAELQIAAAPVAGELLAAGVPDHRPAVVPALYRQLMHHPGPVAGIAAAELACLPELVPAVDATWALLASGPVPDTIQHDDLGDGNLAAIGGRYVCFDWGDSCVSHPFCSLVVARRVAAHGLGLSEHDPRLLRLHAAYLEPWAAAAGRAECERLLEAALWIGRFSRALTWRRIVSGMPPRRRRAYVDSVAGWLRVFLDAPRPR